jgi:F-type H+-transporting ATPase subunit b
MDLLTIIPVLTAVEEEGGNPLISISPGLMLWTLIAFFTTLAIMKWKVFGPLSGVIAARREKVAADLDSAEQDREAAEQLASDSRQRLEDARKEADSLRERGRKEGERQGQEVMAAAQEQKERVIEDAQTQITASARRAQQSVKADAVELAMLAAEKVTRQSLDGDEHRRLIEEAIAEADLSRLKEA